MILIALEETQLEVNGYNDCDIHNTQM